MRALLGQPACREKGQRWTQCGSPSGVARAGVGWGCHRVGEARIARPAPFVDRIL